MCVIEKTRLVEPDGSFRYIQNVEHLCHRTSGLSTCSKTKVREKTKMIPYLDSTGITVDSSMALALLEKHPRRERDRDSNKTHSSKRTTVSRKQFVRDANTQMSWFAPFGIFAKKEKPRSKSRHRRRSSHHDTETVFQYIPEMIPPPAPSPPVAVASFSPVDSGYGSSIYTPPSSASSTTSISSEDLPKAVYYHADNPYYNPHQSHITGGLNIKVDPTNHPSTCPPSTTATIAYNSTTPAHYPTSWYNAQTQWSPTQYEAHLANVVQYKDIQLQHKDTQLQHKDTQLHSMALELQASETARERYERAKQHQADQDLKLRVQLKDELIIQLAEEKAERDFLRKRSGVAARETELQQLLSTLRKQGAECDERLEARERDGVSCVTTRRRTVHFEDDPPQHHRRHDSNRDSGVAFNLDHLKDIISVIDAPASSTRRASNSSPTDSSESTDSEPTREHGHSREHSHSHGHKRRPNSWHYTGSSYEHDAEHRRSKPRPKSWSTRADDGRSDRGWREDSRSDRGWRHGYGEGGRSRSERSAYHRSPYWEYEDGTTSCETHPRRYPRMGHGDTRR